MTNLERKPRNKPSLIKRLWRKYGFPRICRTRKYQNLKRGWKQYD